MLDYMIYCPSYKRAHIAQSQHLFDADRFCFVVREEEEHLYRKLGYRLLTIPKGTVKDISTTRNWILDNAECKHIVMVDDDISSMLFLYKRNREKLDAIQIDRFIVNMFNVSISMQIGIWGVNLIPDPIGYSINKPFSFHTPILGPFCGHIIDDIRYDPELSLKEDYDFYLQKINKYGIAIRANYISYQCDHLQKEGGCQTYRSIEEERRQQELLRKKWGSKIVRYNERNPDSVNMRIRL